MRSKSDSPTCSLLGSVKEPDINGRNPDATRRTDDSVTLADSTTTHAECITRDGIYGPGTVLYVERDSWPIHAFYINAGNPSSVSWVCLTFQLYILRSDKYVLRYSRHSILLRWRTITCPKVSEGCVVARIPV